MARNCVYEFGKRKENHEEVRLTPEKWEEIQESLKKYVEAEEGDIKANDEYVKVVHAHWIICDSKTSECQCSYCNWPAPRDAYGYHREQTHYCVYCGAKMDEVE